MKKIIYFNYGEKHNTQLAEQPDLTVSLSNDVVVQIKAASLNPVDWKIRTGEMKMFTGTQFPRGMGSDFSGIITAVGNSVTKYKIGDEVFGFLPFKTAGSFSEQVLANENLIAKKPKDISFEEAACLPMAGSAALTALTIKSKIKKGDRVFIAGCTGGVGHLAVQIAKNFGATVVGSCHSNDFELAKSIGVDEVYDYSKLEPKNIKTCQTVFDTSGRMSPKDVINILPKGLLPCTVSGRFVDLNPTPKAMIKSLISSVYKIVITKVTPNLIQTLEKLAIDKKIKPIIGATYKLDHAVEVIKEFEKGHLKTKGKIVFSI